MYGWGSDNSWSNSSPGYDYGSARDAYAHTDSPWTNSYSDALPSSSNKRSYGAITSGESPVGKVIKSNAPAILCVRFDVTGSNKANARVFFEKLPLLYQEVEKYLPGVEISFGAIGDARPDGDSKYPLQIRDFKAGAELDNELEALFPEGGGGGNDGETYELGAFYDVHCCEIPLAVKPFYFLLCDEKFFEAVQPQDVKKHISPKLAATMKPIKAETVFQELQGKFRTYILRCKTCGNDDEIHQQWVRVFGKNVILLENPARVVDIIIGIVAAETGNFDDFDKRLTQRQTAAQKTQVMISLRAVTKKISEDGKSVMPSPKDSKQSKPLA